MRDEHRSAVPRILRRLLDTVCPGTLTDAQLIERFVAHRDEAAFEVLVWRHGPLVRGVCHRVLRHHQDAEDAFQATFLILARKAGSIGNGQAVAGWLHRVAHRVAVRARIAARRRAEPLTPLGDVPADECVPDVVWSDLKPVLDEEVNRLPEKYRTAFVLCYLAGKTNAEAARELGCPRGTVLSRLAWARERLRVRLARRGVTLSVGLSGLALAPAAVEAALVTATLNAAARIAAGETVASVAPDPVAALTQGALQTMRWNTITVLTGCLLAVGMLTVGGGLLWRPAAEAQGKAEGPADPPPAKPDGGGPPPKNTGRAKVEEKTFSFEMREKPWKAVIEWYSEASGLPFVGSSQPPGTFTFIAPKGRQFKLAEITDLLNEALLAQKYLLIRRAASFTVVPADEKIDPTLLSEVGLEELDKRGRMELVQVILPLTSLKAADVGADVKKLLGPFGEVTVLETANRLIVRDTAGNLARIRNLVKELEDRKQPAK